MNKSIILYILSLAFGVTARAEQDSNVTSDVDWYNDISNEDIVLTPTRMGQTKESIPGTVALLERETLLERGITSIPEALRLVPGMSVLEVTGFSQSTGHDYKIGYHGGTLSIPRRLQVLVDGVSVYLGGLSKIDWSQLPVTVPDIERIEVTLNPSAASYGANSFNAVVNIITRHSFDLPNNEIFTEFGTRNDFLTSYRAALNLGKTTLSLRVSRHEDGGYDEGETSIDDGDVAPGQRDDLTVDRYAIRADSELSDKTELMVTFGGVRSTSEAEFVVRGQEPGIFPDLETNDYFFNTKLRHRHSASAETKVQMYFKQSELEQDFRACSPAIFILPESHALVLSNPDYFDTLVAGGIPSGGTPQDDALALALLGRVNQLGPEAFTTVCGTLNQDYVDRRDHLSIEHHRLLSDTFRFIAGFTYEHLQNESETFFNGKVEQDVYSLFSSLEWKPINSLTVNAGFLFESPENIDDDNVSPRFSLNWHLKENLTLRAVANKAYRTPDLAETDRNWDYIVRNIQPVVDGIEQSIFAGHASSYGFELSAEEIEAFEFGVLYQSTNRNLTIDSRIFYEELDKLISEKPNYSNFDLSNSGSGRVHGFETTAQLDLYKNISMNMAYSYQDHKFNTLDETGLNSRHQGQAALRYGGKSRTLTLGYIGHSDLSGSSLDRWRLTWIENVVSGAPNFRIIGSIQYQPSDVVSNEVTSGIRHRLTYDDNTYAKIGFELSF